MAPGGLDLTVKRWYRGGYRGVTRVTSHPPPGMAAYYYEYDLGYFDVVLCHSLSHYFNEQHNYFIFK